jgi:glycogen debranching enzyme
LQENIASYSLDLQPGERCSIYLTLEYEVEARQPKTFFHSMINAARELRSSTRRAATVVSSNATLNQVLCRSMADLYMLITQTPQGPYPYGGIPWF